MTIMVMTLDSNTQCLIVETRPQELAYPGSS